MEAQVRDLRNELAIEAERVRNISAAAKGHGDIEAKRRGLEREKAELKFFVQSAHSTAHLLGTSSRTRSTRRLLKPPSLSAGLDENKIAAEYGDKVMEAAYHAWYRPATLRRNREDRGPQRSPHLW